MKKIIFSSFGFKYGVPQDANYVFDVRFIPNPFYVAELKPLTGMDEPVRQYIKSFAETEALLSSMTAFLDCVIPMYLRGGRDVFHAAIGCTGGRHRSVAFAWWLRERYPDAAVRHRDIGMVEED